MQLVVELLNDDTILKLVVPLLGMHCKTIITIVPILLVSFSFGKLRINAGSFTSLSITVFVK